MNFATINPLLRYDAETGKIFRRVRRGRFAAGTEAGSLDKFGHVRVGLFGRHFFVHRLAWLLTYGEWPSGDLDHANGDPADNRLANLRLVDDSLNQANIKKSRGVSKYKGVCFHKQTRKWQAQIGVRRRKIYLGLYDSEEAAREAYLTKARECFGGFAA